MAELTGLSAAFNPSVRALEPTDSLVPSNWNDIHQDLIDNDAYLLANLAATGQAALNDLAVKLGINTTAQTDAAIRQLIADAILRSDAIRPKVAAPANLPLSGDPLGVIRVVENDGGVKKVYYHKAVTGTLTDQWEAISGGGGSGTTITVREPDAAPNITASTLEFDEGTVTSPAGGIAKVSFAAAFLAISGGTLTGNLAVNGNTTLGDAAADTVTFNAKIITSLRVEGNGLNLLLVRPTGGTQAYWGIHWIDGGIFRTAFQYNTNNNEFQLADGAGATTEGYSGAPVFTVNKNTGELWTKGAIRTGGTNFGTGTPVGTGGGGAINEAGGTLLNAATSFPTVDGRLVQQVWRNGVLCPRTAVDGFGGWTQDSAAVGDPINFTTGANGDEVITYTYTV